MSSQYQLWQQRFKQAQTTGNQQAMDALRYIEPYMNTWDPDKAQAGHDYLYDTERNDMVATDSQNVTEAANPPTNPPNNLTKGSV